MSRLPTINAKVMISFVESKGFVLSRQKGSHKIFRHPDGRTATIPCHKGEDLGRGIVVKILNDVDSNIRDFEVWLNK